MADPPPPVAQPDELSPLDYLMHRGESHPATRSAFLNLEILDRSAGWGGCERRSTGPAGAGVDRYIVIDRTADFAREPERLIALAETLGIAPARSAAIASAEPQG